jgi:3-oxo-5-alpha-steroid 4-dehydrogenase 1
MNESDLHGWLVAAEFALAVFTLLAVVFISAPYGRHAREGWGPMVSSRLGWIIMESPVALGFLILWFFGDHSLELAPLVLLALWQSHYLYRAYIYPFRMRMEGKQIPVSMVGTAVAFNTLNTVVNARWVSQLGDYPNSWLTTPWFVVGALIFFIGMAVNRWADRVLRDLRKPGETGYKIPYGGLYRYVSCPNYLGEILQWFGWAVATCSLAGLAFAVYTAANVGPRAFTHHRWYRETFPDYPAERKALLPFVI